MFEVFEGWRIFAVLGVVMLVGVGRTIWRALFRQRHKRRPSSVFVDERIRIRSLELDGERAGSPNLEAEQALPLHEREVLSRVGFVRPYTKTEDLSPDFYRAWEARFAEARGAHPEYEINRHYDDEDRWIATHRSDRYAVTCYPEDASNRLADVHAQAFQEALKAARAQWREETHDWAYRLQSEERGIHEGVESCDRCIYDDIANMPEVKPVEW